MFEKHNPTIALDILYIKKEEIWSAVISKIISNCEKQVILLMISNEEKKERNISLKDDGITFQ